MRDPHSPACAADATLVASPRPSAPLRLSLNDAPAPQRPKLYREFVDRSVLRFDVEPLHDVPFEADITVQGLPGLQLFSGRLHGSCNRRTRAMLADGKDDFSLMVNLGGPYLVSQGEREIMLGDGEATLVTSAEPCSFTHHPPGGVLALLVPRAPLVSLVPAAEDLCLRRIPRDNRALTLLKNYITMTRDAQTITDRELQALVIAHVHDLMAVAIGASREAIDVAQGRGVRAARMREIKQDIARHLAQPDLSVAALAVRHRCTPRFIQRLFEGEGTTFTEYVLGQRLAQAYRLLSDPRRDGEKIASLAYDTGFGDLSYFNRMFRRRFGVSPSEIRAQGRKQGSGSLM